MPDKSLSILSKLPVPKSNCLLFNDNYRVIAYFFVFTFLFQHYLTDLLNSLLIDFYKIQAFGISTEVDLLLI